MNQLDYKYFDIHTHTYHSQTDILEIKSYFHYEDPPVEKYFSIGIHPWHTSDIEDIDNAIKELEQKALLPNCVAMGECGIDKLHGAEITKQIEILNRQFELAARLKKPIVIHCVKGYSEILSLLKQNRNNITCIFHDFNSSLQMISQLLHYNCYFSIGSRTTQSKSENYKNMIKAIPDNKLLLESDESNISIKEIYKLVSVIRAQRIESLILNQHKNLNSVFE